METRNSVMPARTSRRRVRVEFGHCDPAQIAYYPNLIAWVDHSTHHLFESAGFPVRGLQASRGIQLPVVGLNVRFLCPLTWDDEIDIDSHIVRFGSKSFDVHHRITNVATGDAVAEATATRVCVQLDPKHPKRIRGQVVPDDLRVALDRDDAVTK
jgi:4-hydroxybenzoyl-CoA thioesterase